MRLIFSIAIGVSSVLTVFSAQAQTLFTYGPNAVSKEEFLRVYQKNNAQKKPDFSTKSVNEYLDLYSLFRMKVKEAEQMKLDTTDVAFRIMRPDIGDIYIGLAQQRAARSTRTSPSGVVLASTCDAITARPAAASRRAAT